VRISAQKRGVLLPQLCGEGQDSRMTTDLWVLDGTSGMGELDRMVVHPTSKEK